MPPNCVLNFQQLLSAEKRENVNCRIPLSGRVRSAKKKEDLSFPRSSKISSFYFRMSNQNFCPFFLFPLSLSLSYGWNFSYELPFYAGALLPREIQRESYPRRLNEGGGSSALDTATIVISKTWQSAWKIFCFIRQRYDIRIRGFSFSSHFFICDSTHARTRDGSILFFSFFFFLYFTRQTRKCRESC